MLSTGACLLLVSSGCATIRRLHPHESHIGESRQLTQQAQLAIHHERWDAAEAHLLDAIERNPHDDSARSCLADVYWKRGANRAAIEQLTKAIELSGRKEPAALTKLGRMELVEGDVNAALRHASEALDGDRTCADAWLLRGLVRRRQGDNDAALASFFRSLSLRKDNPRTRIEIAEIYRDRGQPRRALAILDAAAEAGQPACPFQPKIGFLRGLVLRELDRPRDAATALAKARDDGHSGPELLFQLADAHFAAGNLVQARSTAEEALAYSMPLQQPSVETLLQRIDVARQGAAAGRSWR